MAQLHSAAARGQLEEVQQLLRTIDPNAPDYSNGARGLGEGGETFVHATLFALHAESLHHVHTDHGWNPYHIL